MNDTPWIEFDCPYCHGDWDVEVDQFFQVPDKCIHCLHPLTKDQLFLCGNYYEYRLESDDAALARCLGR